MCPEKHFASQLGKYSWFNRSSTDPGISSKYIGREESEPEGWRVVGTTTCRFSSAGRKEEKETTTREKEIVTGLGNWHHADRSNAAALRSFRTQCARRVYAPAPEQSVVDAATRKILESYPKTRNPSGFYGELDRDILEKRIRYLCQHSVKRDSKPGVPWSQLAHDNAGFIEENLGLIIRTVIGRLQTYMSYSVDDVAVMTPQQLVEAGLTDPVRVFVKGELHPTRKVEQERWRLIFAVSLIDQIIERLLCGNQNEHEIDTWMTHPSAPGLGLSDDLQLSSLYDRIMDLKGGSPLAEADVTGWDWSVQKWELLKEAEFRARLGRFSTTAAHCMTVRSYCLCESIYAMPDGSLLELLVGGVQKSGCYNTSSTNSRLRVFVAHLVGAEWAIAMGDDCLEQFVVDAREKYAALGHPLKMYVEKQDSFEFCSTQFTPEGAWPVDGTKTLCNILEQKRITPELLFQFSHEMRNHPRKQEFLDSVERVRRVGNITQ